MFKKTTIHGCDARGDGNDPYMTRWTLFESKYFQICLHYFHRSDADEHHDHPWNFLSIPLWRGYNEETVVEPYCHLCNHKLISTNAGYICNNHRCYNVAPVHVTENFVIKRVYPFMPVYRRADYRHRVILIKGKPAITLVFMGKRYRKWGFFTSKGWIDFVNYFKINRC